jgi:hypothetical protein
MTDWLVVFASASVSLRQLDKGALVAIRLKELTDGVCQSGGDVLKMGLWAFILNSIQHFIFLQ